MTTHDYAPELLALLKCVDAIEVDALCDKIAAGNTRRRLFIERSRLEPNPLWIGLGVKTRLRRPRVVCTWGAPFWTEPELTAEQREIEQLMAQRDLLSYGRRRRVHATLPADREDAREQTEASGEPQRLRPRTHRSAEFADMSFDGAVAAEFLRAAGWHIEKTTTGNPVGRQPKGLRGVEMIGAALRQDTGLSVEELRVCGGPNKTPDQSVLYELLCVTLTGSRYNIEATAAVLGWNQSTVRRMRARGRTVLASRAAA